MLSLVAFGLGAPSFGIVQLLVPPVHSIYVDQFLPFITYGFKYQSDSQSYDLKVGNVLQAFLDATEFVLGSNSGLSKALKKYEGVMTVKYFIPKKDSNGNFPAFAYSYFGYNQAALTSQGKLNIVFKKANSIVAIFAKLPQDALTVALEGGGPLVDIALTAGAAAVRFAKGIGWSAGADPLVLDLSGKGLVTTGLRVCPASSSIHA